MFFKATQRKSKDAEKVEEELKKVNEQLESDVKRRTAELKKTNEQLQRTVEDLEKWEKLTVGREIRMTELKKEVSELKGKLKDKS